LLWLLRLLFGTGIGRFGRPKLGGLWRCVCAFLFFLRSGIDPLGRPELGGPWWNSSTSSSSSIIIKRKIDERKLEFLLLLLCPEFGGLGWNVCFFSFFFLSQFRSVVVGILVVVFVVFVVVATVCRCRCRCRSFLPGFLLLGDQVRGFSGRSSHTRRRIFLELAGLGWNTIVRVVLVLVGSFRRRRRRRCC